MRVMLMVDLPLAAKSIHLAFHFRMKLAGLMDFQPHSHLYFEHLYLPIFVRLANLNRVLFEMKKKTEKGHKRKHNVAKLIKSQKRFFFSNNYELFFFLMVFNWKSKCNTTYSNKKKMSQITFSMKMNNNKLYYWMEILRGRWCHYKTRLNMMSTHTHISLMMSKWFGFSWSEEVGCGYICVWGG